MPVFDVADPEEVEKDGKPTTDEQRCRTGWSKNYPPAYFRAQYPHKWVNPRKSTADLDAESEPKKG